MKNYLFVGNGLNRTSDKNNYSWGNLLQSIASFFNVDHNSEIPMPLEFERIVNTYLKNNDIAVPGKVISDAKREVIKRANELPLLDKDISKHIKNTDANGIITTNYDCNLEKCFDDNYKYDGTTLSKYLFKETSNINDIEFYHAHGIIDCKNSICLGYEHYMGQVEKLRSSINTKRDKNRYKMSIFQKLNKEEDYENTWFEKFYNSNIYIVGYGLDISESDIWWLLTHRASMYYTNYNGVRTRGGLNNKVIYYDVYDDTRKNEVNNKHQLLENLHVEIKKYVIDNKNTSYKDMYITVLKDIKKDIEKSKK